MRSLPVAAALVVVVCLADVFPGCGGSGPPPEPPPREDTEETE